MNIVHELWQTVHEQCSPKTVTLANLANSSRTVRQVREHVRLNILLQNITKVKDFFGQILTFVSTWDIVSKCLGQRNKGLKERVHEQLETRLMR